MNPVREEERVTGVFQEVYGLSAPERESALGSLTGGDEGLRSRVEILLAAYDRNMAEGFLERPALGMGFGVRGAVGESVLMGESEVRAPGRAGPFEIKRLLSEGDLASVYLAEQTDPVRRLAAVKVLHAGGRRALMRFELERQAVASMRHAHIAQFYDAGTTETGLAYFAMEHVDGSSITEFCRTGGLSTGERLALFLQACAGVVHAHQRGIIHRDLKPSNILVGTGAMEAPSVKIIDFGVAKAAEVAGEGSRATLTGQVVGTPAYMSPEQLTGRTDAIDTRTDVYSLGLVLFEMLAGTPAFAPEFIGEPSVMWRRPDTRAPRLAAARRAFRGDLDTIVAKATGTDPDERYASVAELAGDIERYVAGLPILARRASLVYTARKFVRRHRIGTGCTLLAVAAAVCMGAVSWQARTQRLDLATQLADAWLNETLRMQRTLGERSARGPIVERLVEQVDHLAEVSPNDPRVLAMRAAALTERGYLAMDSANARAALADFEEALRLRRELAAAAPDDTELRREVSLALVRTGDAAGAMGDSRARIARYSESLTIDEALARAAPFDTRILGGLGWSYERVGVQVTRDDPAALAMFQHQAGVFDRLVMIAPTPEAYRGRSAANLNIGHIQEFLGESFAEAAHRAVESGRRAVAADPSDRLSLHALIRAELLEARAIAGSGSGGAAARAGNAAEHAQELFDRDPSDWDSREVLAVALARAATLASGEGDMDAATAMAARAIPHFQALSARPGTACWDAELSDMESLVAAADPKRDAR